MSVDPFDIRFVRLESEFNLYKVDAESLLQSVQRANASLEERVLKLETQLNDLLSKLTERTISGNRIYPSKIPVDTPVFGSAAELERRIAEEFECSDGDPRNRHTVSTPEGVVEYYYKLLGLIAPTWIKEDPQEVLRLAVWTCLMKLKKRTKEAKPVLYWRRHVEERDEKREGHSISVRLDIPALKTEDWALAYGMLVIDGHPYPILRM